MSAAFRHASQARILAVPESAFPSGRRSGRFPRDALEKTDRDLWAALLAGDSADAAVKRYAALGFNYRSAAELAANASRQELAERMGAIRDVQTPHAAEKVVLGGEPKPSILLSQALKIQDLLTKGFPGRSWYVQGLLSRGGIP